MLPNDQTTDATTELALVALRLCPLCLGGVGGECHTPGCALWMNRAPDVPVERATLDIEAAVDALRSTGIEHALRERAQVVLRAVGLLP